MSIEKTQHSVCEYIQTFLEPLHLPMTASHLFGYALSQVLQAKHDPKLCLAAYATQLKLDEKLSLKIEPLVEPIIELIYLQLSETSIELENMLPNGEMPLSARIYSLVEFLQAFLLGIEQENLSNFVDEPEALEEMLNDFSVLTQMDMDEEDSEESEANYIEIIEYVRIGILLMAEHSLFFIEQRRAKANQVHH